MTLLRKPTTEYFAYYYKGRDLPHTRKVRMDGRKKACNVQEDAALAGRRINRIDNNAGLSGFRIYKHVTYLKHGYPEQIQLSPYRVLTTKRELRRDIF